MRLDEGAVLVGKGHRTKTAGSVRTVPVWGEALDVLRALAAERKGEGDRPVFEFGRGGIRQLSKRLQRFARAAGVTKNVTAYCCRHSFGTRMALAGVPLFFFTKLMGTSVAMIERHYGHYAPEAGAAAGERAFGATPVQQKGGQRRTEKRPPCPENGRCGVQ